jgi:hypothetical protein
LNRLIEHRWRAYIVGGTLRDVMLAPASAFPRDIDVMIAGCSMSEMESVFQNLRVRKTRFGGLHLAKPAILGGIGQASCDLLFDVWRLEDTWGLQNSGRAFSIEEFVNTPFLNIDSVAIELMPRKGKRQIFERGFFQALTTKTLDINYEPNPFPLVCIVRALIMAVKLQFSLGSSLARYIVNYSHWGTINDLLEAQRSHYGSIRCRGDEIRLWLDDIETRLSSEVAPIMIDVGKRRQMELWEDWPPHSPMLHNDSGVFERQFEGNTAIC